MNWILYFCLSNWTQKKDWHLETPNVEKILLQMSMGEKPYRDKVLEALLHDSDFTVSSTIKSIHRFYSLH